MNRTLRSIFLTGTLLALPALALAAGSGHEHSGDMKGMDMKGMHGESHSESYWFGHPGDSSKVTRTIKVTAMDIKFEPTDLTVKAGETVKFEVTNTGKIDHEFVLADAAEQAEHDKEMQAMPNMKMDHPNGISVAPGKTATLIWTFTKAGKLQYGCHIPGHFAAGMVGQLTVK